MQNWVLNYTFSFGIEISGTNNDLILELCEVVGVSHRDRNDIILYYGLDLSTVKLLESDHHDIAFTYGIARIWTDCVFNDFDSDLIVFFVNTAALEIGYYVKFLQGRGRNADTSISISDFFGEQDMDYDFFIGKALNEIILHQLFRRICLT